MALDAGMTGSEFDNSSLPDIYDRIESDTRKRKERINMQFMLADIIANRVMRNEKTPVIRQWDYYPGLFAEDKKQFEEQQAVEEFETYKEKRRKEIMQHNQKYDRQEVIE